MVGLAYKPELDDIRETPSFHVMNLIMAQGAQVGYHDPYVSQIPPTRKNSTWAGQRAITGEKSAFAAADAVVITTAHRALDYRALLEWSGCVIDTRNAVCAHFGGEIPAALASRLWFA